MRGLIVDDVRRRMSEKRGGQFHVTALDTEDMGRLAGPDELVGISDALDRLEEIDPGVAESSNEFFCGFSFVEIAATRGVPERTVQRGWEKGRLYLHHAVAADAGVSVENRRAARRCPLACVERLPR